MSLLVADDDDVDDVYDDVAHYGVSRSRQLFDDLPAYHCMLYADYLFSFKSCFFCAMSAVRANCLVTSISSYREFQAVFRFKFLFTMFLFRFCKH